LKTQKFNALNYLASLNVDVMRLGLAPIAEFLENLGNPQTAYHTILVAGTNGKGSTATMIASILQSSGYRVGLYTSPHLLDVRERIMVKNRIISRDDLNRLIAYIATKKRKPLTYFEFLTAAAFIYFRQKKIDIAVLEVGLGGRLDATNICRPIVSIITNIALEHTAELGRTLDSITREKAGIIKKRGICVTAAKQTKVLDALESICRQRNAKLYRLGSEIEITKQKYSSFADYRGLYGKISGLDIALRGEHQLANCALAIASCEIGAKKGFVIDESAVRRGLKNVKLPARMENICSRPLFVLDGAHNPAGISALCRAIKNEYSYRKLILIFSSLTDKDFRRMLEKIAPMADEIILAPLKAARAEDPDNIKKILNKMGRRATVTQNVAQAVIKAFSRAKNDDLICATGSLYLAGEIKQRFPKNSFL